MNPTRQQFPTQVRPISKKGAEEDELPRDEDGCISDEQVRRDREQLRRQLAEESGVVLTSSNGDAPRKSLSEGLYEALLGTYVAARDFEA
jgi:hypothetical protein